MIPKDKKIEIAICLSVVFSLTSLVITPKSTLAQGLFGKSKTKISLERKIESAQEKINSRRYQMRLQDAKEYLEKGDYYYARGQLQEAVGEWYAALALLGILKDVEIESLRDAKILLEKEVKARLGTEKPDTKINQRRRLKMMDKAVKRALRQERKKAAAAKIKERKAAAKISPKKVPKKTVKPSVGEKRLSRKELETMKRNRQAVEQQIVQEFVRDEKKSQMQEEPTKELFIKQIEEDITIVREPPGPIIEQKQRPLVSLRPQEQDVKILIEQERARALLQKQIEAELREDVVIAGESQKRGSKIGKQEGLEELVGMGSFIFKPQLDEKLLTEEEDKALKQKIEVDISSYRALEVKKEKKIVHKAYESVTERRKALTKQRREEKKLAKQRRIQEAKKKIEDKQRLRAQKLEMRKASRKASVEQKKKERKEAALNKKDQALRKEMEALISQDKAILDRKDAKTKKQITKLEKNMFKQQQHKDMQDKKFEKDIERSLHRKVDSEIKQRNDLKARQERKDKKRLLALQKMRKKDIKQQLRQLEKEQKQAFKVQKKALKIQEKKARKVKQITKSPAVAKKSFWPFKRRVLDRFDIIDGILIKLEKRRVD